MQERFKSNSEFRYQIIVSAIKFKKGFVKFNIPIAFFKKFLSYQHIASVEVSNMARCSGKSDEMRDIISIGCRARNITIYKWEIDNFQIKIVTFIVILIETISFEIEHISIEQSIRMKTSQSE